ncbi:hypothetical protein CAPTEDRAFT_228894 [Capitella teleta]|uniref:Uncharacterized protein n=1 Tax=Capitella teleta TaxID=283909 RepID=R7UZB6_CAPTE|nr:hypothetical protein CAPTEDRAFT_228894 [Capitella teleta]|eukprot:ELU08766.1 hypothetical protein CAPTEDRAFT_228894 [Capitella teleta]
MAVKEQMPAVLTFLFSSLRLNNLDSMESYPVFHLIMLLSLSVTVNSMSLSSPSEVEDSISEIISRNKRETLPTESEECAQADVVMVLDSSGSIKEENWFKVLNFTKIILDAFPYGDRGIRMGVIWYGNRADIAFHLNDYNNTDAIKNAIDSKMRWKDEATNTSGAIRVMYESMFTYEHGDRYSIPNVGIIITDGESNRDQNLTIPEADEARKKGIYVFALGIGDDINQKELEGIGNPDSENMTYTFNVDSFEALPMISSMLVSAACEAVVTCQGNTDILFLIDSSGSVGSKLFQNIKDFTIDVLNYVNIGPDLSNIAFMTYSDKIKLEFSFEDGSLSRSSVRRKIRAIEYLPGTTDTASALLQARKLFQEPSNRPGFRDVIVLITDGASNNYDRTIEEARRTRLDRIDILSVGIGNWMDERELMEIATDPDEYNTYIVSKYAEPESLALNLRKSLCNDYDDCRGVNCENGGTCFEGINYFFCLCPDGFAGRYCQVECNIPADVIVSLDGSTSVSGPDFYDMMGFTKTLVESLPFDAVNGIRFGVQSFADEPRADIYLDTYTTKRDLISGISFPKISGGTNTAGALKHLRENMFNSANGDRPGVKNVVVLVTDGRSNNRSATWEQAVALRNDDVTIVTVGFDIQNEYDLMEMQGMTSNPDSLNFFNIENATFDVRVVADNIINAICTDVNECAADVNPCGNGRCINKFNGFACECDPGYSGTLCTKDCDGQMDIVFMLDSSGSIRHSRFIIMKDFIKDIVSLLDVRSSAARIGVVTYSDVVKVEFHLNDYQTAEDVEQAVGMIPYGAGGTDTAEALRTIRESMFTEARGDREDYPNFIVIVTDGISTVNKEETLPEAIISRMAGIHIIVVSAESDSNNLELKGMASPPVVSNIFTTDRYDELPGLVDGVVAAMCDDYNECESNPCQNGGDCMDQLKQFACMCDDRHTGRFCERECTSSQDLVFVFDASGSLNTDFENSMELAKEVSFGLNYYGDRTRVAAVVFSDVAETKFILSDYSERKEVINALAFTAAPGRTHTADALDKTGNMIFSAASGDRNGIDNVMILMTDGFSNINKDVTEDRAKALRESGVRIISVGIGSRVNEGELSATATDPDSENLFFMPNSTYIQPVAEQILDALCA